MVDSRIAPSNKQWPSYRFRINANPKRIGEQGEQAMTMMGNRRKAREFALQVLYQVDVQEQLSDEQALALFWHNFARREDGDPAPRDAREARPTGDDDADEASRSFATRLVRGVRANLSEIDALITRASRNWRLERMARVDRNLIRLAVYELKHSGDVPAKVAINEAIEIAKRFGTSESPAFVNGILDRCLEELGGR
jgi:N utilization substance protein B